MRTVLVFKTSVNHWEEVETLQKHLDQLVNSHGHWNFDLEDCDNILRVESRNMEAHQIAATLQSEGFYCEEL